MRLPLPDNAERERIRTDLDASLCVEAGAGTGKTSVLTDRVVELLLSGRGCVDSIVVITFTEKAAAELAARVRDELEERRRRAKDPGEAERLRRAARDLYRAHISTIHAFATSLLRERPVEAGIDPGFDALDELARELAFEEEWTRFLDDLLTASPPEVETAIRRGLGPAEMREAALRLHEHRYALPLGDGQATEPDLRRARERFALTADELRDCLVRHDPGEDRLVPYVEGAIEWTERLLEVGEADLERHLLFGPKPKVHGRAGRRDNWGDEVDAVRDLVRGCVGELDALRDGLRAAALAGVLPHLEEFVRNFEERRRRDGAIDFDDQLIMARDLLRRSPAARDYFRRRYRAVLIDEFQDTDPVQAEIALLLTSDDEPGGDWRQLRPAPGRLTVVGDPKQSIYRFRRADIAIYDDVKTGPLADGLVQIRTNFRSRPEIIGVVDEAFGRLFEEERGVQPANVRLEPRPDLGPGERPGVAIVRGHVEGAIDDQRAAEARALAALLVRAREKGWRVRDLRDDEPRECGWRDMAILVPRRTKLEIYEAALAEAGIPTRREGRRDFFQRFEVQDLIWILAAVDDPTDRLALVGALRSRAFGVSDEDLVLHRAADGAINYRAPGDGPSEAINDAFEVLRGLHYARRDLSLAELVRRAVDETHLVEVARTDHHDPEQAAANVLGVVDEARGFAASGAGGLRAFVRHLKTSGEQPGTEVEATVTEESDDIVRVITAHAAKGLQFPLVALANMRSFHPMAPKVVASEAEGRVHFRLGKSDTGFQTPGYEEACEAEEHRTEAEALRLLYVAMTRARDHLIVPLVRSGSRESDLFGQIDAALPTESAPGVEVLNLEDLEAPAVAEPEERPPGDSAIEEALAERAAWAEEQAAERRALRREERPIASATDPRREAGPLAAEATTYGSALVLGEGPPLPMGDAVHFAMERLSLPGAEDLGEVVADICAEGDIAEHEADVLEMCRACLQAPKVKEALASGAYEREVAFVVATAGAGDNGAARGRVIPSLTTGKADLVWRDGSELVVIDYKTDDVSGEEAAERRALEHHGPQAATYAEGLAAATGLPVREVVFVMCRAGVQVSVWEAGSPG